MRRIYLLPAVVAFLAAIILFTPAVPAVAQKLVPTSQIESSMPMLPYMEWLLDPSGRLTVEEVSTRIDSFSPMEKDVPLKQTGAYWLRFTMAARPAESRPASLLLDMGENNPAKMTMYAPRRGVLSDLPEWQAIAPSQRSIFLAPDAQTTPLTIYIRMDNVPNMWFYPMMRTPQDAATALERMAYPAALVAMAVVMLLCLLRGFTENGQWRIWTGLYVAVALFYAIWSSPSTPHGRVSLRDFAAVVAPGIALMLLPHVARHLMDTKRRSKVLDAQYILLSLPGAALAILPVVPGYAWVCRFLDLWPLGAALLLPTTLAAWISGQPGAVRFLLGCLITAGGAAFALVDIEGLLKAGMPGVNAAMSTIDIIPAFIQANAPLWGLALGALLITGTAAPREYARQAAKPAPADEAEQNRAMPEINVPSADKSSGMGLPVPALDDVVAVDGADESLPDAGNVVSKIFDLQLILRDAHDASSEESEKKGLAISWFMPPHLAHMYEGDGDSLASVIRLLMASSVRATARGAVKVSVRRVPESTDPGHLLFNITDTGDGMPPEGRDSSALTKAWELVGAHRGFLSVESGPQGASISFTIRLGLHQREAQVEPEVQPGVKPASDALAPDLLGIIVADENPVNRQLLAFYLEGLPHRVREARSCAESLELYFARPVGLVVFNDQMPMDELKQALNDLRVFEARHSLPPAATLAITNGKAQWELLGDLGITHALTRPVTRTGLRNTVLGLLPPSYVPEPTMEAENDPENKDQLPVQAAQEQGESDVSSPMSEGSADQPGRDMVDSRMPLPDLPASPPDPIDRLDFGVNEPFSRNKSAMSPMPELRLEWDGAPSERNDAPQEALLPLESPETVAEQAGHSEDDGDGKERAKSTPIAAPTTIMDFGLDAVVAEEVKSSGQMGHEAEASDMAMLLPDAAVESSDAALEDSLEPSEAEQAALEGALEHYEAVQAKSESIFEPSETEQTTPEDTAFVSASVAPEAVTTAAPEIPVVVSDEARDYEEMRASLTFDDGASGSAMEWVGEPRPVPRKEPAPEFEPVSGRPQSEQQPAPNAENAVGAQKNQDAKNDKLLLSGFLTSLDAAIKSAKTAWKASDYSEVERASAEIAEKADGQGLRVLARIARCVEGAAKAKDGEALGNLLPDLETAVERNRIALSKGL